MLIDSVNKGSQQAIKQTNLNLVFNLIADHQPISRADIKKITKLSATTISSLCEELIQNGLVLETGMGEGKTSGRKPILLEINSYGGCFLSIEILSERMKIYICDLHFNLLTKKTVQRNKRLPLGEDMIALMQQTMEEHSITHKILAITIGVAGVISDDKEHIASSTVMDIDSSDNFMEIIKNHFMGVPLFLCNSSCLVAYAEKKAANTSIKNLISVDIGDGVGAGLVIGGKIYTGSRGLAGEFGHITIDYNGKQCKCGGLGCLELYTTIPAIVQKVQEKIAKGAKAANPLHIHSIESIAKGLEVPDSAERLAVEETAHQLSFGLASLINIMDPEMIVISGGIEVLGNYFLDSLKKHIQEKCLSEAHKKILVKYSEINGNTVTLGGAKYAFDGIFSMA